MLIAEYWLVNRGDKARFRLRKGFYAPGVISFLVGALAACITGGTFANFPALAAVPFLNVPFFVGPINGIVLSLVLHALLSKVMGSKT